MARLSNEEDEKRAAHVETVVQRFADHGADRAALLTVAFFMSEAASQAEWRARTAADQFNLDRGRS